MLRSETRVACAQSFTLWQHATIEIMRRNLSYYCLFAPRIYTVVLRAHPVRGESHIQRNDTREDATLISLDKTQPSLALGISTFRPRIHLKQ